MIPSQPIKFDLCITTDWQYDKEFIDIICRLASFRSLSTLVVEPASLAGTLDQLNNGRISFSVLFDRASDTSPQFGQLQEAAQKFGCRIIDPLPAIRWASDKATMHLEFISRGLTTPYTIILPSYKERREPQLEQNELNRLGKPFVIKPANTTGGGIGVVKNAMSMAEVLETRQLYPGDKYLLQEKIKPVELDGRRFWFRCLYVFGRVLPLWWDDLTHIYEILTEQQIERYNLNALLEATKKIAEICGLTFFSTEIAKRENGDLVVVDYVNESCDMRLKSSHFDGVPDEIVEAVADRLISFLFD